LCSFIQIKKIPFEHTCHSTGKVEKNSMATNHWIRDRVLNWVAKDPTIGAATLKKRLEEEYHVQLSYYVVWDGEIWFWNNSKESGMIVLSMLLVSRLRWRRPIQTVWWTLNMSKLGRR
jgi:hypothetical protein